MKQLNEQLDRIREIMLSEQKKQSKIFYIKTRYLS